jgi:RNA polymerase primary sigma factor
LLLQNLDIAQNTYPWRNERRKLVQTHVISSYDGLRSPMTSPTDDPVEFYLSEVAKFPPLTKDEENELFEQLRRGHDPDEAAERKLIERKLALVVHIAKRYLSSGMPMLELVQEGNLGLMKAVRTFAANPTDDFTVHASALIEAAIRQAIAERK